MLISEYFQKIESQIGDCIYIIETSLVKDKRSLHIGIIEGELFFTDESMLHFIEFVNVKETIEVYKYSYHYQDRNSDLIFRYDMAPHHREIKTFPHHKHIHSNNVIEASAPAFAQVLDEISDLIGQADYAGYTD